MTDYAALERDLRTHDAWYFEPCRADQGDDELFEKAAEAIAALTRELEEQKHTRWLDGMEEGARIASEYVRQEIDDGASNSATVVVAKSIARVIRDVASKYQQDARLSRADPQ